MNPQKNKPKRSINSRAKGGRVERELVAFLKENGCSSAERTAQRTGKGGTADIRCEELSLYHIECKGTKAPILQRSQLLSWIDQLKRDCPLEKTPVLFWKANNQEWVGVTPAFWPNGDAVTVYLDARALILNLLNTQVAAVIRDKIRSNGQ